MKAAPKKQQEDRVQDVRKGRGPECDSKTNEKVNGAGNKGLSDASSEQKVDMNVYTEKRMTVDIYMAKC